MKTVYYMLVLSNLMTFLTNCKTPDKNNTNSSLNSSPMIISQVKFPEEMRIGELRSELSVTVSNPAPNAFIDGWINWNGDKSFNGIGEHFRQLNVKEGVNKIAVDVPSWATSGTKLATLRLGAENGEYGSILSYSLKVIPPIKTSGHFGPEIVIAKANKVYTVVTSDLDKDGDLDILSASFGDNTIAWYENDGHANFKQHVITSSAKNAVYLIVDDLDLDGDWDVVACSNGDNTIQWFENDGQQNFTSHKITKEAWSTISFTLGDIDGDGDTDLISTSKKDNMIAWYENDGKQNFTKHVISKEATLASSAAATDVDGDGKLDIIASSFGRDVDGVGGNVAWYKNVDDKTFAMSGFLSPTVPGARNIIAADMDGDGDQDVLSASFYDNSVAWYKNDGRGNYVKAFVTRKAENAIAVFAADMDGDGDLDILSASRKDNTLAWFENVGNEAFLAHPPISTTSSGAHAVIAADLDQDGALDIIGGEQYGGRITWQRNLRAN